MLWILFYSGMKHRASPPLHPPAPITPTPPPQKRKKKPKTSVPLTTYPMLLRPRYAVLKGALAVEMWLKNTAIIWGDNQLCQQ